MRIKSLRLKLAKSVLADKHEETLFHHKIVTDTAICTPQDVYKTSADIS